LRFSCSFQFPADCLIENGFVLIGPGSQHFELGYQALGFGDGQADSN